MLKPAVSPIRLLRYLNNTKTYTEDLLAVEEPLEIRVGYGAQHKREQRRISVTMRTPGNDFELAIGFLFTEGIITSVEEIHSIKYCTELNTKENNSNIVRVELREDIELNIDSLQRNFYTTSSCGVCGKASIDAVFQQCDKSEKPHFIVSSKLLTALPQKLNQYQQIFTYTGGLHGCALFTPEGDYIISREDVGRHNALDKLIGALIGSDREKMKRSILLLSGRASFELIQKAAMAQIPLVASVGAPSSLAVDIAKEANITLIGFLKENRFNIYTHESRIGNDE
jgi:FdhD protein